MIDKIEYGLIWWVSGWFGLVFYWTPMVVDLACYALKSIADYRKDLEDRSKSTYYSPNLTIGRIINRALVSFIPIANFFAMFDAAPEVFERIFSWIADIFDMPLVPDSKHYEGQREANKNTQNP